MRDTFFCFRGIWIHQRWDCPVYWAVVRKAATLGTQSPLERYRIRVAKQLAKELA